MKKILKYIRKADQDYHLIETSDKIAIGLSGGKDSMVLLKALHTYQKFKHKQFTLVAIHLNMGFSNMDTTILKEYCKQYEIPYYEEKVEIYEILKHYKKVNGQLDCSRCSNLKRGAIVQMATKYKCNKIAFAHHGDDAIETFLLNAIYGAKLSTFKPKIQYVDKAIEFIRPLVYVHEKEIKRIVKAYQIPIVKSSCPQDGFSKRQVVKEILANLYTQFPQAEHNFLQLLSTDQINLWKKDS